MYDDFKVANYSKALLSPELYARPLSRLYSGDVIDGLTVVPGTGLQVVLQPGNTFIRYGSAATASARIVSLVNTFNLTIPTPDVSNPRHDLVVVYIDNAVALPSGTPTSANLDGRGVAKARIVSGSPASSPSDRNDTAIQAAVGAGNPFTVVARVRVNAGVSVIASDLVIDVRTLTTTSSGRVKSTYSSAEAPTGEYWIDNKPIYRKTISFGSLPNSTSKSVAHGVAGTITVVNISGISINGSISNPLPLGSSNSNSSINLYRDGANVVIQTGANRTAETGYVTILYTKS